MPANTSDHHNEDRRVDPERLLPARCSVLVIGVDDVDLVRRLCTANHEVFVLDRDPDVVTEVRQWGAEGIPTDVTSELPSRVLPRQTWDRILIGTDVNETPNPTEFLIDLSRALTEGGGLLAAGSLQRVTPTDTPPIPDAVSRLLEENRYLRTRIAEVSELLEAKHWDAADRPAATATPRVPDRLRSALRGRRR
jgi:hypothetical protein